MNILGTIFLIDEPHIDVLKSNLMTNPPPGHSIATGCMICCDMDESDNMLELWFPEHCQKATLLCPPPSAMYKEIDGDLEGFIQCYNEYLDYDNSVQDFIASMLLFMHLGGNILLYTPSHIEDDAIWVNTLMMYFYTRFGITIGTGPDKPCLYDPKYDSVVATLMYDRGVMDVFDYINSITDPYPDPKIQQRLTFDLLPFASPGENPLNLYYLMRDAINRNGIPVFIPAIRFD